MIIVIPEKIMLQRTLYNNVLVLVSHDKVMEMQSLNASFHLPCIFLNETKLLE